MPLRRLEAVERLAPAEVIESAEIETTLAAHRDWAAAGRPGAVSHEQVMAELVAVRIEWSPMARASARRFMADQGGYRVVYILKADLIAVSRIDQVLV